MRRAERAARSQPGRCASRSARRVLGVLVLALQVVAPLPRLDRRALAGDPAARSRLVRARRLHARGAAPDRRAGGRVDRADPGVGADTFRLSVTLRSRSACRLAHAVGRPDLTDGRRLVVARALSPRDFRAPDVDPAGRRARAAGVLGTPATLRVSGYTVEIFYP